MAVPIPSVRVGTQSVEQAVIAPSLLAAYVAAGYRVDAAPPFVMRIGQPCPPLATLLRRHHCGSAAFITAWNPGSVQVSKARNVASQSRLVQEVAASGCRWYDGVSSDPSGEWPQEPSVLVLGMPCMRAKELARTYGQNAFVWSEFDQQGNVAPGLVMV
jgi:hypothetical protein